MMGRRQKLKRSEYDVFTHGGRSWRSITSWGRGVTKRVKRQANRRERRVARKEVRRARGD